MSEWTPRHRRRNPGAVVLYVVVGSALLITAVALWAVGSVFGSGGSTPAAREAGNAGRPVEQSATPGDAVGDVDGRYRIWIPSIGVSAPVVEIASDADRVLLPPEDPLVAGWWSQGVAPGDDGGSAVVVGHAVESGRAVFNDVGELQTGDVVLVNDLSLHAYQVSAVEVIERDRLAEHAEDLFDQAGPSRPVLVTCQGWDGDDFTSNVVVIAEPVA